MATRTATPRAERDPAGEKRRALKLAAHAARKFSTVDAERAATFAFAADKGASLREIAGATGVPHMTVKRLIVRAREG